MQLPDPLSDNPIRACSTARNEKRSSVPGRPLDRPAAIARTAGADPGFRAGRAGSRRTAGSAACTAAACQIFADFDIDYAALRTIRRCLGTLYVPLSSSLRTLCPVHGSFCGTAALFACREDGLFFAAQHNGEREDAVLRFPVHRAVISVRDVTN